MNEVVYQYPKLYRHMFVIGFSAVCILLPMLIGHPQILVGSVINCILILSALYLKNFETAPAILFPSIGVVLAGVLFGGLTGFVAYMIPFIWLGNFLLVWGFKRFFVGKRKNYWAVLLGSSVLKSIFLGIGVSIFVFFGLVPFKLLGGFSVLQFATALIGGGVARIFADG